MTRNRFARAGVVLALVASLVAVPTVAFAQTDEAPQRDVPGDVRSDQTDQATDRHRDFPDAKRRALAAVRHRIATVERLIAAVEVHDWVDAADKAALLRDLRDDLAGLQQLEREIEAATSPEELKPLVESMIVDFRIYVLQVPKTHLVLGSNLLVHIGDRLESFHDKLVEITERLEEAGFEVMEVWELLDEMAEQIRSGVAAAGPVAGSVLPLQPPDWPDPAQATLRAGRADLHDAAGELRGAHGTGAEAAKLIREILSSRDGAADLSTDS